MKTIEEPEKLAMKAPAGGAVVNNLYLKGGQFIPRVLGRIRDIRARVLAARRARNSGPVQMARRQPKIDKVIRFGHETHPLLAAKAWPMLADHLMEMGHEDAGQLLAKAAAAGTIKERSGLSKVDIIRNYPKYKSVDEVPDGNLQYVHRRDMNLGRPQLHLYDLVNGRAFTAEEPKGQTEQPGRLARSSEFSLAQSSHRWSPGETAHGLIAGHAWPQLADRLQEEGLTDAGEFLAKNFHRVKPYGVFRAHSNTDHARIFFSHHDGAMNLVDHEGKMFRIGPEAPVATPPPARLARKKTDDAPLAAQKFLPGDAFTRPVGRSLYDHEIKAIEDAHHFTPDERLVREVNPDGTVRARVADVADFFDNLAAKRLSGSELGKVLADPNVSDEAKSAHVSAHASAEADAAYRRMAGGKEWYGSSIGKMEEYLHHILSRERPFDPKSKHKPDHPLWGSVGKPGPGMRLFKALLAFTSGNTKPIPNLQIALAALKSGLDRDPVHPFEAMDHVNHGGFSAWLDHAKKMGQPGLFDAPAETPDPTHVGHGAANIMDWMSRYGEVELPQGEGYKGADVLVHKGTGKIAAQVKASDKLKPMNGYGLDQINRLKAAGRLRMVRVPMPGPNGELQPAGWGNRGKYIDHAIGKLKDLIAAHGGDYGEAADFLDTLHADKKELLRYTKSLNRGDLESGDPIPGSWIFGPKFGPFYQNVSRNPHHVTMDKWWTRTVYRYLGSIMHAGADGDRSPSEAPRTNTDRRMMRVAAARAAEKLGVSNAELQAVLWYHEQHLWRLFGAKNDSADFADAGREALQHYGFPAPKSGVTGSPGADAGRGAAVPGDGGGGGGSRGGKARPPTGKK